MTKYDDIYGVFIARCQLDSNDLPNTVPKQYDLIKNGIFDFNIRMDRNVGYDDVAEQVDIDLTINEIMLIVTYMKIIVLKNKITQFATEVQAYGKEIVVKFLGNQLDTIKDLIAMEEKKVEKYYLSMRTEL